MISQTTIDSVLYASGSNLVELISVDVKLKRTGSRWVGLCPFHNEKTPSFHVTPALGIYKCFGCGKGGSAIEWLISQKKMTFPEAVRHLAELYNIEFQESGPVEDTKHTTERHQQSKAAAMAHELYHHTLMELPLDHPAVAYLLHWRKFEPEMLNLFDIGYTTDQWRHLTPKIIKADLWTSAEALGLVAHKNSKNYDVLRNRIVFPIHGITGQVVGFGARAIDDSAPKYLNSKDCLLYKKEDTLYGLYQGQTAIRERGHAWLVEGYTDVIALHQAGYPNTVASCGTAFTEGQARLLARHTNRVVIYFDPDCYQKDREEIRADKVWRAMRLLMAQGVHVQICRAKYDPADLVMYSMPDGNPEISAEAPNLRTYLAKKPTPHAET